MGIEEEYWVLGMISESSPCRLDLGFLQLVYIIADRNVRLISGCKQRFLV